MLETKERMELKGKKKVNRKALAIVVGNSVVFILLFVFTIVRFSKEPGKTVKNTQREGGVNADSATNKPAENGPDAAGDVGNTGAEYEDNPNMDESLSAFPFLSYYCLPHPENVQNAIKNMVSSADDPDAFAQYLSELKRIVEVPPDVLFGLEAENYAEEMAQAFVFKKFRSVVVSNVSREEINRALEVYHKVVGKTKAVAELPKSASEIKDVQACQIAWKCINEGKLSAEDKSKLEKLLLSPSISFFFPQDSFVSLGRKLETSSVEEAAASVKTYFMGSYYLKENFKSYLMYAEDLQRSALEESYAGEHNYLRGIHAEYKAKIPNELKDEALSCTGAKETLLKVISGYQDLELVKCVSRNEIPTKEVIIAAINSPMFPKSDSLFMTNFSRQLLFYIQNAARKQLEANQLVNRNAVGKLLKFCRFLCWDFVLLAQRAPVDERITSLQEWKDFIKDPNSLNLAAKAGKAVSDLGLETSSISGYASIWSRIKDLETGVHTDSLISKFVDLFMFKFDQSDHPYYNMKEALFDTSSDAFKQALTNFKAQSQHTAQEVELLETLDFYLSNIK